jgi:hypothetical protein
LAEVAGQPRWHQIDCRYKLLTENMESNTTLFYFMTALVALIIGLSKGGLGGMPGAWPPR